MSKRTALIASVAILGVSLLVARPNPVGWWQVRQAKLYCEELAALMDRTGCDRLESDPELFNELREEVGWTPRLLWGAHSLGWDIKDDGPKLTLELSKGEGGSFVAYSYQHSTGEWTTYDNVASRRVRVD